MSTSQTISLPLDIRFDEAGNFTWSPDGLRLALSLADNPSSGEGDHPPTLSVMVIDLDDCYTISPIICLRAAYDLTNAPLID